MAQAMRPLARLLYEVYGQEVARSQEVATVSSRNTKRKRAHIARSKRADSHVTIDLRKADKGTITTTIRNVIDRDTYTGSAHSALRDSCPSDLVHTNIDKPVFDRSTVIVRDELGNEISRGPRGFVAPIGHVPSLSAGSDGLAIRFNSTTSIRATKTCRAIVNCLMRLLPGLKLSEMNAAPERQGKLIIARRFLGLDGVEKDEKGNAYVPVVLPEKEGSAWYSVTGRIDDEFLAILSRLEARGIVKARQGTWRAQSSGTNAYMPHTHEYRAKMRMLRKLELKAAQEAQYTSAPACDLTTLNANDTLPALVSRKDEVIHVRKHGRKQLPSELPALEVARVESDLQTNVVACTDNAMPTSDNREPIADGKGHGAFAGKLPSDGRTIFTHATHAGIDSTELHAMPRKTARHTCGLACACRDLGN